MYVNDDDFSVHDLKKNSHLSALIGLLSLLVACRINFGKTWNPVNNAFM